MIDRDYKYLADRAERRARIVDWISITVGAIALLLAVMAQW